VAGERANATADLSFEREISHRKKKKRKEKHGVK
jgi:hypothetical protein